MKWHPLMFGVILGASPSSWAKPPELAHNPMQPFGTLVGGWQCQAQQMHIGLDHFDLEYIDAQLRLQVSREVGSQNLRTAMQATSLTSEPLFQTETLITYDPQRSVFVQYESTHGGSDATLYTSGFSGPCVTWRYASDTSSIQMTQATKGSDISIEATYCLAESNQKLRINYTLHLTEHDPFVLLTANCDRTTGRS